MELSFNLGLVLLTIVKLMESDDVELSQKNGHMALSYWLTRARRTTSMVLLEEPIISRILGVFLFFLIHVTLPLISMDLCA